MDAIDRLPIRVDQYGAIIFASREALLDALAQLHGGDVARLAYCDAQGDILALTAGDLAAIRENARLRERVAALELSMRLAATRMDILVGRMRGCHEMTGMHELLDEAEMFVQEARAALSQAGEGEGR